MEFVCVHGGMKPMWDRKLGGCLYTERKFLVKSGVWIKYCSEYLIPEYTCLYPITSSVIS